MICLILSYVKKVCNIPRINCLILGLSLKRLSSFWVQLFHFLYFDHLPVSFPLSKVFLLVFSFSTYLFFKRFQIFFSSLLFCFPWCPSNLLVYFLQAPLFFVFSSLVVFYISSYPKKKRFESCRLYKHENYETDPVGNKKNLKK